MNEGSEVLLDHPVHPFNENGVLCLKELMGWIGPFIDRLSYEFPGDDEWVVIRELSCLGPELDLSGQTANGDQCRSPQCHVHNLIHVYSALIRTQLHFLRRKEGGWLVMQPLPRFVWSEVRGSLLDSVLESHVEGLNGLVDSLLVRCALHVSR